MRRDLVYCVDCSRSMGEPLGRQPILPKIDAVSETLTHILLRASTEAPIDSEGRVGIVTFRTEGFRLKPAVKTLFPLLPISPDLPLDRLRYLEVNGDSPLGVGLEAAIGLFKDGENHERSIKLISDFGWNRGPDPRSLLDTAQEKRIGIDAIVMRGSVQPNNWSSAADLADVSGGRFYNILEASRLLEALRL